MLIGVKTILLVKGKRLAAVLGAIQVDSQNIHIFVVGRIDADLTEIHGPRIDAIDPLPRLAAVSGLIDSTIFKAVGSLLVLDVFALSTVHETIRSFRIHLPKSGTADFQGQLLALLVAQYLDRHLVAGIVGAEQFDKLIERFHIRSADFLDDVANQKPALLRHAA